MLAHFKGFPVQVKAKPWKPNQKRFVEHEKNVMFEFIVRTIEDFPEIERRLP